jgi:pilus assembly protein Flp/PilA
MKLLHDQKGQGAAEYALIVGLIAVVCIVVITNLGTTIKSAFSKATNGFTNANGT